MLVRSSKGIIDITISSKKIRANKIGSVTSHSVGGS